MVANIRTGATVGGAIRYNEEKVNRGKAVVLFWNSAAPVSEIELNSVCPFDVESADDQHTPESFGRMEHRAARSPFVIFRLGIHGCFVADIGPVRLSYIRCEGLSFQGKFYSYDRLSDGNLESDEIERIRLFRSLAERFEVQHFAGFGGCVFFRFFLLDCGVRGTKTVEVMSANASRPLVNMSVVIFIKIRVGLNME